MTAKIFTGILPPKIIQTIESYQHSVKNANFIARWMNRLNHPVKKQNIAYWKMLIRDSENLVIQLPHAELSSFNFAHFVQDFLQLGGGKFFYRQFQTFCKNTIVNNPSLLLNKYYIGQGGAPCYQLFLTFLFSKRVNRMVVDPSEQLEDSIFNIFKIIMKNQYLGSQDCYRFFYMLQFGIQMTKYKFQVLQLLFQHYEAFFIDANLGESEPEYNCNTKQILTKFFKDILKKYCSNSLKQHKLTISYLKQEQQEKFIHKIHQRNAMIKRFLQYFQKRHCLILQKYQRYLIQQAFQYINYELLNQLIKFPGFYTLIFSEEYIYHLVKTRKIKQFTLLWSFEEERTNISKFRYNEKNILEIVAQNRGLTHNLIDKLWISGLFSQLPKIKNQKSKDIIHARYKTSGKIQ